MPVKAAAVRRLRGITAPWITAVRQTSSAVLFISCVQSIRGQRLWPFYYICDWIVLAGTLMRWLTTWAGHYFRHGSWGGWHEAATSSELISPETEWRQRAEPREMCAASSHLRLLFPLSFPFLLCLPFPLLFLASDPKAPTSSNKARSFISAFQTTQQSTLKSWSGFNLSQALWTAIPGLLVWLWKQI